MNWLDTIVTGEMESAMRGAGLPDPLRTTAPCGSDPCTTTPCRVPGQLVYLGRVVFPRSPDGQLSLKSDLANRIGGKQGFVYDILDGGGTPLDVGSASSRKNLVGRLTSKRKVLAGARFGDIRYVDGLPAGRFERRLVVIHEMWRKYQLRGQIRGYKAWQWYFDEADELDELI